MRNGKRLAAFLLACALTLVGFLGIASPAHADPGCTALFSASRSHTDIDPIDSVKVFQSNQVYNTTAGCPRIHIGHESGAGHYMRVAWFGAGGIYAHTNWTWVPSDGNYHTLYPGPLPAGLAYVLESQWIYGGWSGPPTIIQS